VFAGDVDQVELPDGRVVDVRPIDGIGFDLYSEMEADRSKGGSDLADQLRAAFPVSPIAEVKT
jgi:hypothetical protein